MLISLVVIDDFDIEYVAILKFETNTPFVVHPDAPLPFAITPQGFKVIARWRTKKIQRGCGVQLRQLAFGNCLNRTEASRIAPFKQRLGILAGKQLDHDAQDITLGVICQQEQIATGHQFNQPGSTQGVGLPELPIVMTLAALLPEVGNC